MWQCKSQLTLQEGVLYYKWEKGNETRLKLVVPQSLKDEVLRYVHDTMEGGHFGHDKTTQNAKRSFYWYHMNLDTKLYVRTCSICSRNLKKNISPRKSWIGELPSRCCRRTVHMDITGPFVTSHTVKKYCLMITCQFTKWLECHAISDQTAEMIVETFCNE